MIYFITATSVSICNCDNSSVCMVARGWLLIADDKGKFCNICNKCVQCILDISQLCVSPMDTLLFLHLCCTSVHVQCFNAESENALANSLSVFLLFALP